MTIAISRGQIDTAVATRAVQPDEFERLIVDSTVQEKAVAFRPTADCSMIARYHVVKAANFAGR